MFCRKTMHLNAVFRWGRVFLQGSPAVFFALLQKPPGYRWFGFEGKMQIPATCRNHLCSENRVWPGVNIHFGKAEWEGRWGRFVKVLLLVFLQTSRRLWG